MARKTRGQRSRLGTAHLMTPGIRLRWRVEQCARRARARGEVSPGRRALLKLSKSGVRGGLWAHRLAEALVSLPVAADEKYFNDDLHRPTPEGLRPTSNSLRVEHHRLRLAAMLSDRLPEWAYQRLDRIEAELESRRAS